MKQLFLKYFCALLFLSMGVAVTQAQVCLVDSQYTSPGIYPDDTLSDMFVNTAYNEVVQFVFPSDTTISGFTLNFDSFVVAAVTGVPSGINWECNANHPQCHYICTPPALTRGCVKIFGLPTAQSPAYPGYDSIIVTGQAWVTIPFTGPVPFNTDIPIYYRTQDPTTVNSYLYANFNLQVAPNPVKDRAKISYQLGASAMVGWEIYDVFGRQVQQIQSKQMSAGKGEESLAVGGWSPGIYLVKAIVNDGEYETVQRFLKLN